MMKTRSDTALLLRPQVATFKASESCGQSGSACPDERCTSDLRTLYDQCSNGAHHNDCHIIITGISVQAPGDPPHRD